MTIEQPRLVLLPGMDGTGLLFAPFLEWLGKSALVQTIRYPADVCSYSQVMNYLASQVNVEEPHIIVAESFSSPAALLYAATNPRGLQAIVIVAGFHCNPLGSFVRVLLRPFLPLLFMVPLPALIVRLFLLNAKQETVQWAQRIIGTVPAKTLRLRLGSVMSTDINVNVCVPMLYLRAQGDWLVTKKSAQIFQQRYPETRVIELSGSHLLLQSNPAGAAREIICFKNLVSQHPNR